MANDYNDLLAPFNIFGGGSYTAQTGPSGAAGPVTPFGVQAATQTPATPTVTSSATPPASTSTQGPVQGPPSPQTPAPAASNKPNVTPSNTGGGQVQAQTAGTPQPAQPGAQPGQPTQPTQSNPFALSQVTGIIQQQLDNNNKLVSAKNLVLQQLYGVPLTDAQKAQLPPDLKSALDSGDRNIIDFNLRLLNDQIAGRTNTVDQSVKYLSDSYNTAQQQLETQKQNSLQTVQNFITQFGDQAGPMLTKLFGPDKVAELQRQGIDVTGITSPTINQQRYGAQYGYTSGTGSVGGYDLSSYATAPGYAGRVAGIASTIGPITDAAGADAAIQQQAPGSPITGQMVMQAANQYGVDPTVMLSLMQADTRLGTDGHFGSRVNNYGDVGVNDTLAAKINAGTATPAEIASVTMTPQQGVDAVAKWLSKHPASQSNIDTVANGIIKGSIPPPAISSRPTQYMLNLESALEKKGFNLTKATEDWTATQKWMATANSAQQLRLRQAINFAGDSLSVIDQMNQAWNGSGFPAYNKAALALAEQGVTNAPLETPLTITVPSPDGSSSSVTIKDKQTLANLLNAQISDLTSEMGTVYKGGYSSTDDSLALAAKNLSADWSYDTLKSALDLARTNLQLRKNSISTVGPVSTGGTNAYAPSSGATPPGGTSGGNIVTAPDGTQIEIIP